MTRLAAGRFEVLGPLGQDQTGEFAFLARDLSVDRLVVLKRWAQASGGVQDSVTLKVIDRLDSSVPPPAGACPVCQAPFAGWDPTCPDCGGDVAGSFEGRDQESSREQLLAAVKAAAPGYEVLGTMVRASGGATVYFAREAKQGSLVALRLEQGERSGFTVAATRMMRPKHLYGTVGGDSRESGSPPGATPWSAPITPRRPTTPSGAGSDFTAAFALEKVCPQCGESFGPELRFCPRDGAGLRARARSEELIGQVIAERYHILSKLGEGGMGRVYLAEHVRMGRRCAVKVMNPMLLYDPDSVSRFNREAANASQINHPNVAAIYDFGESDDLVYLAMELVEGESLAALLVREGALPELRAIGIAMQVADALNAAHEFDIVHRDLKPDNIMIARSRTGEDVVKVVDFGIAKATRGGSQKVTRTGFIVGTPAYMSPEQILGETLDGRSDLYSLGCILYEMLTGERAFADASGEISLRQRLTAPPPRPSKVKMGLSSRLDAIVTSAMARAPDQRTQSAVQFREELNAAAIEAPTGRWRDWLPWKQSKVTRPKPISTGAVLPGSRPGLSSPPIASRPVASATAPGRPPETAPVPGALIEEAPPKGEAGGATTVFRHRSARPKSSLAGWIAAGCVGAALAGLGGWKLLSDHARASGRSPATYSKIVLPKTAAPPAPIGSPRETTGAAVAPPSPPAPQPPSKPAAGTLRFADALPPGATVTVDGSPVSLGAGGAFSLPPGRHLLRVEAPGYRPMTQSASIVSGQTATVRGRLLRAEPVSTPVERPSRPAPTTGTIVVTGTLLPGGEVSLDGVPVAGGSREISASIGSHWLTFSAAGYRADSSRIDVKAGGRSELVAPPLVPLPKQIVVDVSTPDTAISLGSTAQFRASVRDESGAPVNKPLVWESSNPQVARVERDGRVIATGAGRAYVRARSENHVDSTMVAVLRVAKPAPEPAPEPPPAAEEASHPAAPAAPTPASFQNAAVACAAALGSKDEQQIVGVYQAKTALDVTNLRKLLDVALRTEAQLAAAAVKMGTQSAETPRSMDARLRFSWRNNAGVNKTKEAPFRVELKPDGATWKLAACRATEKLGF